LAGIARGGQKQQAPAGGADRGLVKELFQALAGAVLADDDHYGDLALKSSARHSRALYHARAESAASALGFRGRML